MKGKTSSNTRRISERVTIAQSEKNIIDLILLSISCIAFLRGFFSEKHFAEDRFIVRKDPYCSESEEKDSIRIKKLKWGISDQSDTLLNWINTSVTDGLRKKYLKAINLSIVLDNEQPNDLFETYCFHIQYNEQDPYNPTTIGFMDEFALSPTELTKIQVFNLLKKCIILTQSLSPLPNKRFLSMRLFFNESCPKDYQPELFVDCTNEKSATMRIPLPQFENITVHCGDIDSIHHQISTSLISLSNLTDFDKSAESIELDPFQVLEPDFNLEQLKNNKNDHDDMSQVTKELTTVFNNFDDEFHDGQTQRSEDSMDDTIIESQSQILSNKEINLKPISCTCGSSNYLTYSKIIECNKCHKSMHSVCYSVGPKENSWICFECSNENNKLNMNDMKIVFNIRKIIAFYQYKKSNIFSSVTAAAIHLGFYGKDLLIDKPILKNIVDAFSVLIYDKVFSLRSTKCQPYNMFDVDVDGLLVDHKKLKKGKYFMFFKSQTSSAIIQKYLDPWFGRSYDCKSDIITEGLNNNGDMDFDKTMVEYQDANNTNNHESESFKKRKVSKSVDVFKV